jgi:hypothetical protein
VSSASIGYSGSSLRYGLLDIQPVEFKQIIKRAGIKFQRVIRRFDTFQQPQTYSDIVTFQYETIFGSIKIPEWFDSSKLVKELSQRSIANYEKDTEFKKAVDEIKNNKDHIARPLLSFVQFAKTRFESEIDNYLEVEADRFLRSNFPLSFYNKLLVFDNTYREFLAVLEDIVRTYEFRARFSRSFDMYKKHISEMKWAIGPIIDQVDSCFLHYFRLKEYVTIWNTTEYAKLSNPAFWDVTKLDPDEFDKILKEYDSTLMETRSKLLQFNESALIREPVMIENLTGAVFSKLVTLPSGSLTL